MYIFFCVGVWFIFLCGCFYSVNFRTIVCNGSLHIGHGHRLVAIYFFMVLRMHLEQNLCPQFVSEMFGMFTVSMQMGQSMDSVGSLFGMRLFM